MPTEAEIKVIVQEYMNAKVVYRDNCIERHKGVDKLEKKVDWMLRLAVVELLAIVGGLVTIIISHAL